ncbi:MAG: phosphatidylglycerophosphatase A [Deltaproteobacteria bacterium]|nr:phosphatidylglycerophosphatase A [Deltaproteobacteria bacterium]
MNKIALSLASGLGIGYSPWASGTFGTLWGILFYYLLRNFSPFHFFIAICTLFILSIPIVHLAEKELGSHDSGVIILDEILGYLVAVWALPFNFWTVSLGFALFRLFDIWKPFPISYLDKKINGAIGVIIDDIAAGLIANLILWVLWYNYSNFLM